MAYEIGVATDHDDLFTKLKLFLTTNVDLVADNEEWTVAWTDTDSTDIVLQGPGLSVGDTIYVGLHQYADVANDRYWLSLRGMTGIAPLTGTSYSEHINVSPEVRMFLDNAPMDYWFVASGRRFICVVKISTVFESCHAGLFLPYATPVSYPYPFYIAGSAGPVDGNHSLYADVPYDWRSLSEGHSSIVHSTTTSPYTRQPSAYMLDPIGQWIGSSDQLPSQIRTYPAASGSVFGRGTTSAYSFFGGERQAFGGDYALKQVTLVQESPADQTWGVLQGVYRVPGFELAVEDIITIDGVDHLVVQNAFRTTVYDYWALRLE